MNFQQNLNSRRQAKVILNIYDLNKINYYLHSFGLGFYHTGIQVFDQEYSFASHESSGTGVFECAPQNSFPEGTFRQSIELGVCTMSTKEIYSALDQLKSEFSGKSYNLLLRNCNHFSNEVSLKLLGTRIPGYINRMASIGSVFKCCIPAELLNGPNEQDQTSKGGYSAVGGSKPAPSYSNKGNIRTISSFK